MFDTSCQLFLSRLIHSSGGTKFGIFREHVIMLTTGILYCYAAAGPGCLIICCKLCSFLSRKLNEVQCQFTTSRCIYCFVYILYSLLNKQLRQLPSKRSLSENRSYHIRINKQRFCEQNNCCLPSLCHFTRNKYYTVSL